MKAVYFNDDSIITKLDKALVEAQSMYAQTGFKASHFDLTQEEYNELLEVLGAPPGAMVKDYGGVFLRVNGKHPTTGSVITPPKGGPGNITPFPGGGRRA